MPHAQLPASAMTVEVRARRRTPCAGLGGAGGGCAERPGNRAGRNEDERRQIAETIGTPRALAALTAVAGTIGLLLACVGLYGVVSYQTARRTQEIGIRMALGAGRADLVRLVLRQTVVVIGIGYRDRPRAGAGHLAADRKSPLRDRAD